MNDFLKRISSRKFIVAVVAAVVAFGNGYFDWGLSTEQVWVILIPLLGFLGVEGAGDIVERYSRRYL